MSLLVAVGGGLALIGVAGVRYAPEIVAAQLDRGMAPVQGDEIDASDRIRVTRWTGGLVAVVGLALIVYGVR